MVRTVGGGCVWRRSCHAAPCSFRPHKPPERLPGLADVRLQLRIRPTPCLRHEAVALDGLLTLAQPLGDATALQGRQNERRTGAGPPAPAPTLQQGASPAVIAPRG